MNAAPLQKRARGSLSSPISVSGIVDLTNLRSLGLTPRECEVMRWISEGKRDREIAIILNLSARTVGNHAHHIFHKLDVETRTAAARHCAYAMNGDASGASWKRLPPKHASSRTSTTKRAGREGTVHGKLSGGHPDAGHSDRQHGSEIDCRI